MFRRTANLNFLKRWKSVISSTPLKKKKTYIKTNETNKIYILQYNQVEVKKRKKTIKQKTLSSFNLFNYLTMKLVEIVVFLSSNMHCSHIENGFRHPQDILNFSSSLIVFFLVFSFLILRDKCKFLLIHFIRILLQNTNLF